MLFLEKNEMLKITLVGCLLIVMTTIIHSVLTRMSYTYLESRMSTTRVQRIISMEVIVLMIILAALIEASLWAGCYLLIGAFQTGEEALYFSLVTFSTLGYGDVVLTQSYRLLGGFEAANGIIIFGWSTAILVDALQRLRGVPPK